MKINFSQIKEWQSLVGAFIGAFLPISFALYIRWRDGRKNYLQGLWKVEKFLAYSINQLYELRESMELFVGRISNDIAKMEVNKGNQYVLDSTNFPVQKIEYEVDLFNIRTKSIYLTNKLMMCHLMLKNINDSIDEIRDEYQMLKGRNFDMVFSGKISIENQNQLRIEQLLAVENILRDPLLEKNVPQMIKALMQTKIILLKYLKFYGFIYRVYYEGFFRMLARQEDGQRKIEDKLEQDLNEEFDKVEKRYCERISTKK